MKKRRQRGSGSIFRKPPNPRWFIQFYKAGKRVREATGTKEWAEAAILLRQRLNEVAKDEYTPHPNRAARIEDLYRALEQVTAMRRPKRPGELEGRWKNLAPTFAALRARELKTEHLNNYIVARQKDGAANATINRELAALKRMFKLGCQADPPTVERIPHIPMLKEDNARKGFVEYPDFLKLRFAAEAEPLWLRVFLELGFAYGWRRGELLGLRVRQVDFGARTIRLDPGSTKNGEGREVAMTTRIAELLRLATAGKAGDAYLLSRSNGSAVQDFRRDWRRITARAGLPDLLVHDLRRSAAKALRRAGVPESVIMATGGWKTASMFRRYAIVSSADQRDAMEKLEADRARTDKLEQENSPRNSPFSGPKVRNLQ